MWRRILFTLPCCFFFLFPAIAQAPPALLQEEPGASFSLLVQEVESGDILYAYDERRELTPASVMKAVTTATALEVLGEDFRFATRLECDGELTDGILRGNLYIKGSGDPSLGSAYLTDDPYHFTAAQSAFVTDWLAAIRDAGIRQIQGAVIADESVFDNDGLSPKWLYEDMGNYYSAGAYGLNVFDNAFSLRLIRGDKDERPVIESCEPEMPTLRFHNHLTVAGTANKASISGFPFSEERHLYGVVPANRPATVLRGDIPDPALFLAQFLTEQLTACGISVAQPPSSHRLEAGSHTGQRRTLYVTYSPPLRQIVRLTNERSLNLYADALLKAVGQHALPSAEGETTFERGIRAVQAHWQAKGMPATTLRMHDGSGLSPVDKLTAAFLVELLRYMAIQSPSADAFVQSLPRAGSEGTVSHFLRNTPLQGVTRLKSGSMHRTRCFAGYVRHDGHLYAVALLSNNYTGSDPHILSLMERLLLSLFHTEDKTISQP